MMNEPNYMDQPNRLSVEDLFKKYYLRLFEFAYKLSGNEEEAEDLVQDAFVVFCEQTNGTLWSEHAIKSYLYTTIKHDAFNRFRHHKVVEKYQKQHPDQLLEDFQIDNFLIHAEVLGELMAALDKLPGGCAMICRMGYLEGLKNPQIAELLGISIHTVKSQKQRALHLLKEQLKPELFTVFLVTLLK
ncbi:RNA polymerase sigma-70 factor [Olivibacter sp. SA151]|uniref:RNA polymerase sigma-70 factor n=1 Tax=Olivibacter jilunii TaxID=985016 RepID=UPI003F182A19